MPRDTGDLHCEVRSARRKDLESGCPRASGSEHEAAEDGAGVHLAVGLGGIGEG